MCVQTEQYVDATKLVEDYEEVIKALQFTLTEAVERFGNLETRSGEDIANFKNLILHKEHQLKSLQGQLRTAEKMLENNAEKVLDKQLSLLAPTAVCSRYLVDVGFNSLSSSFKAQKEKLEIVEAEKEQLKHALNTSLRQVNNLILLHKCKTSMNVCLFLMSLLTSKNLK
jgi:hypothetical protein